MNFHLTTTNSETKGPLGKTLGDGVRLVPQAAKKTDDKYHIGIGPEEENGISWNDDYQQRMNPSLMTDLLRKAVPVLESVDWRVKDVTDRGCHSILPVCEGSTNQHGTHQAALISLAADYTGGIALATLIRGVPVIGVHPCPGEMAASMWLASMKVRYRKPSIADLHGRCTVPVNLVGKVQQRYAAGKRILITLVVEFTDPQGESVAEAEMRYFLQARKLTKPCAAGNKPKTVTSQKLKASARLIAGLRAKIDRQRNGSAHQYDHQAAGPHGTVLAQSLSDLLPQLQKVVSARTAHIDDWLVDSGAFSQVVLLGAGLDMRPFRLAGRTRPMTTFEIDLPAMLQERRLVVSNLERRLPVKRCKLAADFTTDNVGQILKECPDFDLDQPTMVIYEGCSMYFTEEQNTALLSSVCSVLRNRNSVMWADMVTRAVVDGTTHDSAIAEFLDRMNQMGETFVFGCDEPVEYLRRCGFGHGNVVSVKDYLKSSDETLSTYQFVVSGVGA